MKSVPISNSGTPMWPPAEGTLKSNCSFGFAEAHLGLFLFFHEDN